MLGGIEPDELASRAYVENEQYFFVGPFGHGNFDHRSVATGTGALP